MSGTPPLLGSGTPREAFLLETRHPYSHRFIYENWRRGLVCIDKLLDQIARSDNPILSIATSKQASKQASLRKSIQDTEQGV